MSFSSLAFREQKKVARREQFLQEMDQVTPWSTLEGLIEPYYPKAGNGRRPTPLSVMLRIYLLQQWFALSDPAMENALYDSTSMQRFAGLELGQELHSRRDHHHPSLPPPAETRHHHRRDHHPCAASVYDSQKADELLHGPEKELYGDKAYADAGKRQESSQRGVKWRVNIKASRGRELIQQEQKWNQSRNRVRSRGLYKNRCQLFSLFLLCNLYRARKSLIRIHLIRIHLIRIQKYELAQAG